MKVLFTSIFMAFLFITCKKELKPGTGPDEGLPVDSVDLPEDSDVIFDTDALIPLNDLGANTYRTYTGGLYPHGLNEPNGQYAQNLLETAKSIVPLNEDGNPDPKGYVVFISMGASTGGKNMTAVIDKTNGNPAVNPRLKIMNGNQPAGLATLEIIIDSTSEYWAHVLYVLQLHKTTPQQVQVIYLETDDGINTMNFPERPNIIKFQTEACMRTMKSVFQNLKLLYLLGRPRTFNIGTPWNTEPSPYHYGWACKWVIEDQINNKDSVRYTGPDAIAPMATWGFYQWADSLPRKTDNFYWRRTFSDDGLHANAVGQDTLSNRFQQFLLTDKYAKQWYAAQ